MIYFAEAVGVGNIKIGFTDGEDAEARIATLQTGCPVPIRLLGTAPGSVDDEKNLHRRFAAHRVTGEWFKPVPDILALIGLAPPPVCDGVTIAERSVSIRVLTVGRKQFTRSLLDQLPTGKAFDWSGALGCCPEELCTWSRATAVWGWVKGGKHPIYDSVKCYEFSYLYRWLIFQSVDDHRLMKAMYFPGLFAHCLYHDFDKSNTTVQDQFDAVTHWPGWRDEDQLFFGV